MQRLGIRDKKNLMACCRQLKATVIRSATSVVLDMHANVALDSVMCSAVREFMAARKESSGVISLTIKDSILRGPPSQFESLPPLMSLTVHRPSRAFRERASREE